MYTAIRSTHVYDSDLAAYQAKTILLQGPSIEALLPYHASLPDNCVVIDVGDHYVLPGFIDGFSQIGAKEIGIRWEGEDETETAQSDDLAPYRIIDSIYPNDAAFKEALANGVTVSHVASGPGSVIGAQTAIVKHDGVTVDEMAITPSFGHAFSLGDIPKRTFKQQTNQPLTRMGIAASLRRYFDKHGTPANVFIRAYHGTDIDTALRLQEEYAFTLTLVHGTGANERQLNELKQRGASLFAGPMFQARERHEQQTLCPSFHKEVVLLGIPHAIISDHPTTSVRNLKLEAALAVREGLDEKHALNALTLATAECLGISDKTGSITAGKQADIAIWNGDPLSLTSSVTHTFVSGKLCYEKEKEQR
ncbi:hypothetical protein CHH65_13160 [Shouchella clausii]|uniref:amidohydrolase family protein n=1 Tax=Shouchella clausii TaxID=79880 RepID=UPI000BA6A1D8|nr:amidohydrolase family protein [Shouchella clausii]PAF08973.1 hypothetical protein CHH65_13160 [Shouchella clausii]